MSSAVTAIAIAGSIVLSLIFAVVVVTIRKRMEVSTRLQGSSRQSRSELPRSPPLVTYFIRSVESRGLYPQDIDLLCKEYVFKGVEQFHLEDKSTLPPSTEMDPEVKTHQEAGPVLCCICLEDLELDSLVRTLPCNHTFHSKEICRWLCKRAICPYCRLSFEHLTFLRNYEDTSDHLLAPRYSHDNSTYTRTDDYIVSGFQRHSLEIYPRNDDVHSLRMTSP